MKERAMEIHVNDQISVHLVGYMGDDLTIAMAAKVSTGVPQGSPDLTPEKVAGLIGYLMKHRHGTPFEHGAMTFLVRAPIFVWREHHRHRVGWSYNEESARYKQLQPEFWVPSPDRKIVPAPGHTSARPQFQAGTTEQNSLVRVALERSYSGAYSTYDALIKDGYAKEVARACLPVAIYSSCWTTCNPRSLMHFLSLRTHEDAAKFVSYPQAEIEQVARQYEEIFAKHWPVTHAAFVENGRVAP
jgi:thymidylate synthase (FAD)